MIILIGNNIYLIMRPINDNISKRETLIPNNIN